MSNWNVYDPGATRFFGFVPATSSGVVVTAGANFTKGNYTEIVSSVPRKCNGVFLTFNCDAPTQRFALDIAIGALGSEIIVVENLPISTISSTYHRIFLPISFNVGQRISVRASTNNTATQNINIMLGFSGSTILSPELPDRLITCNFNVLTNSAQTFIDAGAVAHTKGAWTQLINSTPRSISGFLITTTSGDPNGNGNGIFLIDIGVGSLGEETPVLTNMFSKSNTSTSSNPTIAPMYVHCPIPAGQRISARAQCNFTSLITRTHGVILHLV